METKTKTARKSSAKAAKTVSTTEPVAVLDAPAPVAEERVTILNAAAKQAEADALALAKAEAAKETAAQEAAIKVAKADIAARKLANVAAKVQAVRNMGNVVTEEEDVVSYAVDKLNSVARVAGKRLFKYERGSAELVETKAHADARLSYKLETRKVCVTLHGEEVAKGANVYALYDLLQSRGNIHGIRVSFPHLVRLDGGSYMRTGLQVSRDIVRIIRKAFEVDAAAVSVELK